MDKVNAKKGQFVSQQLLLFLREAELVLYILRQGAILRVYHVERRLEILPAHANHGTNESRCLVAAFLVVGHQSQQRLG